MTIAKMLELAQTLPYEIGYTDHYVINKIITAVLEPMDVSMWTFNLQGVEERLKFKLIYSQTTDNFKFGDQLRLVYLDDVPMVLVDSGGRWMSTVVIYSFDPERLEQLREFFYHIRKTDHDIGPTTLTDEMLTCCAPWWGGKLTDPDGYPYRNDT